MSTILTKALAVALVSILMVVMVAPEREQERAVCEKLPW